MKLQLKTGQPASLPPRTGACKKAQRATCLWYLQQAIQELYRDLQLVENLLVQITGVLLFFFLTFGYFFAATWPGRQQLLRRLRIEELFSIYEVFYVTHAVMGLALLILLLIHPWPDSLSSHQPKQKGTTWIYLLAGTFVCLLERLARLLK